MTAPHWKNQDSKHQKKRKKLAPKKYGIDRLISDNKKRFAGQLEIDKAFSKLHSAQNDEAGQDQMREAREEVIFRSQELRAIITEAADFKNSLSKAELDKFKEEDEALFEYVQASERAVYRSRGLKNTEALKSRATDRDDKTELARAEKIAENQGDEHTEAFKILNEKWQGLDKLRLTLDDVEKFRNYRYHDKKNEKLRKGELDINYDM